ncbi:MAG: HTH-type transcriptional repressor YvoA [Steroidobacteraceae bacterium]|nr:HTH-type transcriptional repressor YvoA [Steroidobacteraceae bacterium]
MNAAVHRVADTPSPRYYQVYVTLRAWVRDGTYGPGAQIPTEADLCRHFGVSRITVRKALADLVREGWLVRHPGRGTFVALSAARAPAFVDIREAMMQVADLGAVTEVIDARVAEVVADDETLAALDLEPGARVQRGSHVRLFKGVPLAHVTTFVPLDIAATVGRQPRGTHVPMFELLERSGIRVREADQWVGATLANIETGRALAIGIGAPLLKLTRIVYDVRRRPVERVIALYRADAYQYRMHLSRPRSP